MFNKFTKRGKKRAEVTENDEIRIMMDKHNLLLDHIQ